MINKFQTGSTFKRLDIVGLQNDPQWQNYQYPLNQRNLEVFQDSMYNRKMGFPQRIASLTQTISENGGNTTPHGNGAFGMFGWRGGRAVNLPKDLPGQIHKFMEEVYNNSKFREWTHGGKGTGVQTGAEMQQLFRTSPNVRQANNALMKGYVRPPASSMQKRHGLAELIKRYMK